MSKSLNTTPRTLTVTRRTSETVDTTGAEQYGEVITLDSSNGYETIFYGLPQFSEDGTEEYTYFVEEITEGYIVNYEGNTGVTSGTIKIHNTKPEPTTMNVTVTKLWKDESGNTYALPESATRYFKLFVGENEYSALTSANLSGATLENGYIKLDTPVGASETTFTLVNLPVIDGEYTVKEYILLGATYQEVADYVSVTGDNSITVTNKVTSITVNKTWAADGSGNAGYEKPTVNFELWRYYGENEHELVGEKPMNPGETTLTWDMLPLTADGTAATTYTYYVKEQLPAGFVASNEGKVDVAQGSSGTITNTPTELTVEKLWKNLNEQTFTPTETTVYYKLMRQKVTVSGDTEKTVGNPEAVSSEALTLTSNNDWKTVHSGLPLYWKDGDATGEYRYFVVETDASGKELPAEYSYTGNGVSVADGPTITITNWRTSITVRKLWSINGGKLPENLPAITLELRYTYEKGTMTVGDPVADTVTLTANTDGVIVYPTGDGSVYWQYIWPDLPAFDLVDGVVKSRYYYIVETNEPQGFRHVGTDQNNIGITVSKGDSYIQITNELITYELPETGGAGTTPYTVCGLLMFALALTALMYKELKQKKQWGEGRES